MILSYSLQKAGYEVLIAHSAEEALTMLQSPVAHIPSPIDLILLDIMMGEMSGLELANRLQQESRATNQSSSVPSIIFLTALSDESTLLQGFKLGADVPFCIVGNAALAEGVGEELTYIKGLSKDVSILVCKPELFVSTKDVYGGLDLNNLKQRPNNKLLIEYLKDDNIEGVSNNMVNVLETVTSKMHEEINDIEKIMNENKALGSMMSGSGPTVFGIYKNIEDALKGKKELLKKYKQVYVVNSNEKGVEING
jgi:4-diphosphocytidyl-2C-methyl-D-erythritol kinase